MYTFDQYFWLEITNNKTVKKKIHQLVLHIVCKMFVQ